MLEDIPECWAIYVIYIALFFGVSFSVITCANVAVFSGVVLSDENLNTHFPLCEIRFITAFISVDLPQPLLPMSAVNSPE